MDISPDSIIAVVGAGTMGAGIAQVAAAAGHPVRLIDSQPEALARARAGIETALAAQIRRGKLSDATGSATLARIGYATDLSAAAGAALVIEAIVERLDAKNGLFAGLTAHLAPDAILATNTSSLSIEAMAEAVCGTARFAGLHFFNPVPAMRLVEVVAGSRTDPAVVGALTDLMQRWGKHPVTVRDVPGFIVNRVARPYYAEGFAALGEGIAPALIDQALTGPGGFRMGPLALADLIGHDVNFTVARSVFDAYRGRTRFRPQAAQQALFDAGRLGRKTGTGVYDYAVDVPSPVAVEPGARPQRVTAGAGSVLMAPLVDAAAAAGLAVDRSPALPSETLDVDGIRLALGDGRPLADRPDIDVLIDHARDFACAPLLVATARDTAGAATAAALAQAIGKRVVAIPDRPGQIVLRTLAQLANAAADAVADDVASPDGIDDAMKHGANHPEGPLQWARRIGREPVAAALSNIATATGDPIYAPAARLTMGAR